MSDTQWLLDLVEEATPENLGPNDSTAKSGDAWLLLAGLAPDLARLCVEQHEILQVCALDPVYSNDPYSNVVGHPAATELIRSSELARVALARFAELKP